MNKFFVQILSLFLLLSVLVERVSPLFTHASTSIVLIDTEEGKGKETEKQKDSKEQLFRSSIIYRTAPVHSFTHLSAQLYFKYTTYLSLPELPPDKA